MEQPDNGSIMVIGADSHFCYLMRRYVKEIAYDIVFAYTGDNALALAQKETPSAIILEVDQHDTSGWDLLKILKNDRITANIPIVLCSWLEEDQRGINEGADAYLRKPILFNDFINALALIGIATCH